MIGVGVVVGGIGGEFEEVWWGLGGGYEIVYKEWYIWNGWASFTDVQVLWSISFGAL